MGQQQKEKGIKYKSTSTSKHNKNNKNPNDNKEEDDIIDTLQIHLESKQNEIIIETKQHEPHQKHAQRRSTVLEDYGIISGDEQVKELQVLSRQYSSPNIITPTPSTKKQ